MTAAALPTRFIILLLAGTRFLAAGEPSAPVRTTMPRPSPAQLYQVPGRTEPVETATIFTRATGVVQSRNFDIGDAVKAGDVLATIETPEVDRAIDAAQAEVEQTRVRAGNARALADRGKSLLASESMSREVTEQRAANAAEFEAGVRVAEAALARLEEQKKFATVRAPFDGVVAARNFDRGDRVRGDSATSEGWLYRLVRIDVLRFTIAATPDLALSLGRENAATIRFNEFPGRTFPATVARSSRIFDPASGTMRVELLLPNSGLAVPAGLTGTAVFDLKTSSSVVVVPNNTLFIREGRNLLAIVENGKVAFIPVTLGRNLGPSVEVTSDRLKADTAIIINPNALLQAGDPVDAKAMQPAS